MKRFYTLCMLLLVAGAAHAQTTSTASKYHYQRASLFEVLPIHRSDIVFLGNSITDGGEWMELFGNNPHVKNRGISADKTYNVLNRLDPIVKGQPRKLFLMIGINDLGAGETPEFVLSNIRKIVERFETESPRTKLYIQSLLPVNDQIGRKDRHQSKSREVVAVNEGLKELCAEKGLTYIDLHTAFKDDEGRLRHEYTNDGLHLLGAGYKVWQEILEPYVK